MADIEFKCPNCQHTLVVDKRGAGKQVPCPDCDKPVLIPVLMPKHEDPDITLFCSYCGQSLSAGNDMAGEDIECPACGKSVTIPPVEKPDITFFCSHCGQSLSAESEMVGKSIACPSCNRRIEIPSDAASPRPKPLVKAPIPEPSPQTTKDLKCPKCGQLMSLTKEQYERALQVYTPYACPNCKTAILVPGSPPKPETAIPMHGGTSLPQESAQPVRFPWWVSLPLFLVVYYSFYWVIGKPAWPFNKTLPSSSKERAASVSTPSAADLTPEEADAVAAYRKAGKLLRIEVQRQTYTPWSDEEFYQFLGAVTVEFKADKAFIDEFNTDFFLTETTLGPMGITKVFAQFDGSIDTLKAKMMQLVLAAHSRDFTISSFLLQHLPSVIMQMKTKGCWPDSKPTAAVASVRSANAVAANAADTPSELGEAAAQYDRGMKYAVGDGVEKNSAEAAKWFRKAAERGHAVAQYSLGCLYDSGDGVTQDYSEAFKWYKKAAEQGNAFAQYSTGDFYRRGLGVAENTFEALNWFKRAAEQGDQEGIASYNALTKELNARDEENARLRQDLRDRGLNPDDLNGNMEILKRRVEGVGLRWPDN